MIHTIEFISLVLTVPTILLSLWVVALFGPKAWRFISTKPIKNLSESELLVIGITIGFIGNFFDNIYWGIAWTVEFLNHDEPNDWFKYGAASNVPFRQLAGIIAATCHIAAAILLSRMQRKRYFIVWLIALLAGVALLGANGWRIN